MQNLIRYIPKFLMSILDIVGHSKCVAQTPCCSTILPLNQRKVAKKGAIILWSNGLRQKRD